MANLPIRTSSPIRKQKHSPRRLRRASTFPTDAGYSQYPSDISPQNPSSSHPSLCSSVTAPLPGPHQTPFQLDQPSSHHRNTYPQPQTQTQTHFPISPVHQQELNSFVTHTENEDIQTWLRSILPLVDPLSTMPIELEPVVSGNSVNQDTSPTSLPSPQTSIDSLEPNPSAETSAIPVHTSSASEVTSPTCSLRRRVRGRRTSPNSTLMCPECNQGYSRRDNLVTHMRMHNGDMPYQCTDCGERFKWASTLKSHEVSNKCRKRGSKGRRRSKSSTRSRSGTTDKSSLLSKVASADMSSNSMDYAGEQPMVSPQGKSSLPVSFDNLSWASDENENVEIPTIHAQVDDALCTELEPSRYDSVQKLPLAVNSLLPEGIFMPVSHQSLESNPWSDLSYVFEKNSTIVNGQFST